MHFLVLMVDLGDELLAKSNLIQHRTATDLPGGVFAIHATASLVASPKSEFRPVERVLGPDPLGQLYIGWSDDLLAIVAEIAGKTKPQQRGDAPFTSAYRANVTIMQSIGWDSLVVSFLFHEVAVNEWAQQLGRYNFRFGEHPPFNNAA